MESAGITAFDNRKKVFEPNEERSAEKSRNVRNMKLLYVVLFTCCSYCDLIEYEMCARGETRTTFKILL